MGVASAIVRILVSILHYSSFHSNSYSDLMRSKERDQLTPALLFVLGALDYLSAEISTSKQKKFSLVTFIDTPGLVDGDMRYPFDVNSAITWLGMSKFKFYLQILKMFLTEHVVIDVFVQDNSLT